MTHIIFDEKRIELAQGQSVLSALLDHNYDIPNSCQVGVCQSCMMQVVDGEIPVEAQAGLKDTLKAQGYFLACSCQPTSPLQVVSANDAELRSLATVLEHEILGADILRLCLIPPADFNYRAGQFISIWKSQTLARSYSLASVAALDDKLELHIRRIPDGQVSNWLHDEIKPGDTINIQAASGDCFYVAGDRQDIKQQKMLLAGTGTGLAPLIGIARDALSQGHSGDIHLIHGARRREDLYLHQRLQKMAVQHKQFHYHTNVLEPDDNCEPANSVSLEQQILQVADEPAEWRAYLCGDAAIVNSLKKTLFMSGMVMSNIHSDPFVATNAA